MIDEDSPTCQAERQGRRRGARPTPPACQPLSSPAKEGLLPLSGATQTAEASAFLRPRAPASSESALMAPAAQLQPLDHWEAKLGPLRFRRKVASWSLRFPGPGALASRMGARSSLTPLLGPLHLLCLGLVLPTAAALTTGFPGCRDSPLGRVCFLSLSPESEDCGLRGSHLG